MRKYISILFIFSVITTLSLSVPVSAKELELSGNVAKHRFAAGDRLPVTLQLTNFGYLSRVDVTIRYTITDANDKVILTQSKTAAVETTASFTDQIQLPDQLRPGIYTVRAEIEYAGQEAPGASSYSFVVERTVFGFFIKDLFLWGGLIAVATLVFVVIVRRRRIKQLSSHTYENIPHERRVYYEIIDDVISQMRLHDGDNIFKITASVPGLSVNKENGKIEGIQGDPAAITAELMKRFEQKHDIHINLSFTKEVPSIIIRKRTK